MNREIPHYLLLTEVFAAGMEDEGGRWQFILQQTGGSERIEAADDETGMGGERLQLLSVVRGLEALPQPSSVTLVTASRYVGRGIRSGLAAWKESNWRWERFGEMAPVKNCDLWKRIDRAMSIHWVECRLWRADAPQPAARRPRARTARNLTLPARPVCDAVSEAFRGWSGAFASSVSRLARAGYAANL